MNLLENHLRRQVDHAGDFFWHRLRWKAVARNLPVDRTFRLVDVGAGAGILGEYLERARPQGKYHFVEEIASLEQRLVERFGSDRNARKWTSYAGVDVVTVLDVIEHQADDHLFVADLVARMAPGSTLVATVPALMSLWSQWDVALGHHRRYTRRGFADLLAEHGFRVVERSYLFPELVPPALWRRLRSRSAGAVSPSQSEFPELPRLLNEVLYVVGRGSLALRRWWPVGTSVLVVAERE